MARVLSPLKHTGGRSAFQEGVENQSDKNGFSSSLRTVSSDAIASSSNSQKTERTHSGTYSSKHSHRTPTMHDESNTHIPMFLWNSAVSNSALPHLDLDERPLKRSNAKQQSGPTGKAHRPSEFLRSQSLSAMDGDFSKLHLEDNFVRHKGPPSRSDAVLLCNAYDVMLSNIRQHGKDSKLLAKQAAHEARAEELMEIMEPELYVVDTVLVELSNQIRYACQERGALLERIRLQVLEYFSIAAVGLQELYNKIKKEREVNAGLLVRLEQLESDNSQAVQKMAAMTIEMRTKDEKIKFLSEEHDTLKRRTQINNTGPLKSRSTREIELEQKLLEMKDLEELYKSQLFLVEAQEKNSEKNNATLQTEILDLQERVRRDAEEIECLSEEKARYKIRAMWLHTLLLLRRTPRERQEASTQDGEGIGRQDGKSTDDRLPEDAQEALKAAEMSRKSLFGRDAVISFPVYWEGLVANASSVDLDADAPHLKMTKKELLEFISKIYTNKILADEQDDKAHFPRETLPEFLYEYHLETFGDSSKASDALVKLVANLRIYSPLSARVRMFCKFLNLIPDQPTIPEAINVFLLSLVKLQSGFIPLLPAYDGVHVAAAKALQTVDYIFAQAPYVVRSKLLLEVERKMQGKQTDLDSLLAYIVEQYMEEAGKGEERLKAIFAAADADSDGQLEYAEYIKMMNHLGSVHNYRKLMRMFAEMTLSRVVTSSVFVQVCRKWKALLFEPGPAVKKAEKNAVEVFALLNAEWTKLETIVHELLVVLEGTPIGRRLEEHVKLLRTKLHQKLEVEQAWHCYRSIIAEFTSAVRNRTPGLGFSDPEEQAAVEAALNNAAANKNKQPQHKRRLSRPLQPSHQTSPTVL